MESDSISQLSEFIRSGLSGKEAEAAVLALQLRDLFIARNGAEILDALGKLDAGISSHALPSTLEYDFNRLFVGPAAPEAPLWASVYLESEPRLMGQCTLALKQLCAAIGLAAPAGYPEDWLPFELELWLALLEMENESPNSGDARRTREWLVNHLESWLPLLVARMRHACINPALLCVATRLEDWLNLVR